MEKQMTFPQDTQIDILWQSRVLCCLICLFSTSLKSILLFPWKLRSPTVINERPMGKKRIDIVKAWRLKFYNKFESYFTFQSISCFFSLILSIFFLFCRLCHLFILQANILTISFILKIKMYNNIKTVFF